MWREHRENPGDPVTRADYREADGTYRQEFRKFKIKREHRVIERDNAESFFRFVNRKLSSKRGLGALTNGSGIVITDDLERANLLNTYLTSMCTDDSGAYSQTFDRVAGIPVDSDIETIAFTPGLVNAAIKKLKLGGTIGSNGLPPRLFDKLADSIAGPLSLMFTSFMSIGKDRKSGSMQWLRLFTKNDSASGAAN